MNLKYKHAALAALMVLASGAASAQRGVRNERADDFSQSVSYATYLKGKDLRASEIVGARVRNPAGDNFGEIKELVIPTANQNDMLIVVSVGGVADIGDKLVALPYKDLRISPDGDTFYFDRTEEQLKAAPAFSYEAQAEAQARVQPARDSQPAPAPIVRTTAERPSVTAAKSNNLVLDAFDYRASDLIGAAVLDDRGEHVAKVDDIVVSLEDHKLHAVLAVGGFVGFGAKLISIPFDELQITANGNDPQVRIKMTGDQLQQLVDSRSPFHYERQVAKAPGNAPRG